MSSPSKYSSTICIIISITLFIAGILLIAISQSDIAVVGFACSMVLSLILVLGGIAGSVQQGSTQYQKKILATKSREKLEKSKGRSKSSAQTAPGQIKAQVYTRENQKLHESAIGIIPMKINNIEELKAKRDIFGIIPFLDDDDADVCIHAVKALGDIGDERAVEPLRLIIEYAAKKEVLSKHPRSSTEDVHIIRNKQPQLLRAVIQSLKEIGGEKAIESLYLLHRIWKDAASLSHFHGIMSSHHETLFAACQEWGEFRVLADDAIDTLDGGILINVEALPTDDIQAVIKSKTPEGYLLYDQIIKNDGSPIAIIYSSASSQKAIAEVRERIPNGAVIISSKVVEKAEERTVLVEIEDETSVDVKARQVAIEVLGQNGRVKERTLVEEGRKGFLGIGQKPRKFNIVVHRDSRVSIKYKPKVEILAVFQKVETVLQKQTDNRQYVSKKASSALAIIVERK